MMFFSGEGTLLGILLLFGLSCVLMVLAVVQAIRAMRLPGWRKILYPAQMILGFWAIILGAYLPIVVPLVAIASVVLGYYTRQADPHGKWLATFWALVTLGLCLLTLFTF